MHDDVGRAATRRRHRMRNSPRARLAHARPTTATSAIVAQRRPPLPYRYRPRRPHATAYQALSLGTWRRCSRPPARARPSRCSGAARAKPRDRARAHAAARSNARRVELGTVGRRPAPAGVARALSPAIGRALLRRLQPCRATDRRPRSRLCVAIRSSRGGRRRYLFPVPSQRHRRRAGGRIQRKRRVLPRASRRRPPAPTIPGSRSSSIEATRASLRAYRPR